MLTPEDLIQITRGKAPWPYTPLELVRSRVTHAYPWGVYSRRYKNYIQGMETGMQCRNLCTGV